MIRLAIDAMGGDNAPQSVVEGVELARNNRSDIEFLLFGDEKQINSLLHDKSNIQVIHASEVIEMGDEPVRAVKRKKDSSLVLAAQAVKEGKADALVSIGNTGALLVASLLILGRIKGIDRPGFTATMPVVNNDKGFTMVDAGANADAKVSNIEQYALLGKFYSEHVSQVVNPKIGLINNGTEADKGDMIHRKMHDALQSMGEKNEINFVGNIESRELLNGVADVVVTDGFTGNAVLKAIEGTAMSGMGMLKESVKNGGLKAKLGALLMKDSLKKMAKKMDYRRYGGAVLLGINSPVVKGHGNSDAKTIKNCLFNAADIVSSGYVESVKDHFTKIADNQ